MIIKILERGNAVKHSGEIIFCFFPISISEDERLEFAVFTIKNSKIIGGIQIFGRKFQQLFVPINRVVQILALKFDLGDLANNLIIIRKFFMQGFESR